MAYDESLGDQLRVTVIATGLSSARKAFIAPPLMSVVQQQPVHHAVRMGTDNLPILNQVARWRSRPSKATSRRSTRTPTTC